MKAPTYFMTLEGAMRLNRLLIGVIGLGALSVGVLAVALILRSQPIQIEPLPALDAPAVINKSTADAEAQVAKGMYLVTLVGNVTPTSVDFLSRNISRELTPRMYQPVLDAIQAQAKQIQQQNLRLSFSPSLARFDEATGKVVITGEVVVMDIRGNEARELRTYEMGFVTRNYKILLNELQVTQGNAPSAATTGPGA